MNTRYDLVVVGSGIAGLFAALLAAPHASVLLVTKDALEESNTRYAQGGIAAALQPPDSSDLHLRDTLAAGGGLCDPAQVAVLTREAGACIRDLVRLGVPFDREGGDLARTLEAAHSLPRILHAGGDATGAAIQTTLAAAVHRSGVAIRERALCTDLLMHGGVVTGVRLLDEAGNAAEVPADHVLLATGGAGHLFARTTNPAVATGDGVALAYRAGAPLMDLEFVQFHPTALAAPGAPAFLISEAVRGEGGILRDVHGRAFMAEYHPDADLAPRDVVARANHQQMLRTGAGHVYLDITQLEAVRMERRFPGILAACRRHGIEPLRHGIPVAPAAHYWMGGVRTDGWARTGVPGLWACGEVACTGVHGANRLASNSLLEGLVFARRAVTAMEHGWSGPADLSPARPIARLPSISERAVGDRAEIMWRQASLVRSRDSLLRARRLLDAGTPPSAGSIREQVEERNLALLSRLLVASALVREESRGAHFRADFAGRDPAWQGHSVVTAEAIGLAPLAGTLLLEAAS